MIVDEARLARPAGHWPTGPGDGIAVTAPDARVGVKGATRAAVAPLPLRCRPV